MSGTKQKNMYQEELINQFSKIYSDMGDGCPSNPLLTDVDNRQQILFMQYQMEKRGKNLGMSQSRLFKIEQDHLYQQLPLPNSIVMLKRENQQWQSKYQLCKAKIVLRFTQRSDITLYFKEIIEWRQIGMYLLARIRKQKDNFLNLFAEKFKMEVVEQMVNSIHKIKKSSTDLRVLRNKTRVNDIFKYKLSDRALIGELLSQWKSTVLFQRRQITLKIGLSQLIINKSVTGQIKLWTKGTVSNQFTLTQDKLVTKGSNYFKYSFQNKFAETFKTLLSDDQIQFQIECKGITFKSERFTPCDLCKIANKCKFIQINLIAKQDAALLKIYFQIKGITSTQLPISITPKHFRVIDQLYVGVEKRFNVSQIYQFYLNQLKTVEQNRSIYISFNRCKQVFQLLKIQQLIDKFYLVSPFKDYINVKCKGSIVYQYFVKDYNHHLFYDVQKIMWKHPKYQYKRILHALKSFDQNPKFNFTQPFLFIVEKMYDLALNQTINRWKHNLFSKDIIGIQTITFFLSLSVVKMFSSLFVQQEFVNKRSLPFNSLLFIYILQKHQFQIQQKLLKIQLNIEAFFGKHIISLYAQLFSGDLFNKILITLVEQRQKDMQNVYIIRLVSIFLALTEIVDKYSCAYASAQHYIITFEQICKDLPEKFQFFAAIKKWQKIVIQQLQCSQFKSLSLEMTDFYLNNFYSGELGQISRQIYQQFISYHYKNEMDLRKIFIMIDKIQINQPSTELTLSIFQSATKIYQHNFKGVNFNQLQHFIQLKLTKLQQLNIICNNGRYSFSCRLDPKEIPSNLYFHLVKPLILTYHMSPQSNRHIFLQIYIKDNCEIQSLQNPIPLKYRQILLEKTVNKQDIIFCKKFTKSFRMRQNNFNLLYTKLGWFNNHYLFPDDRFINLEIIGPKRANQQQIYNQLINLNHFTRSIYGRAILPYPTGQTRRINIQMIKQGVRVNYQPLGSPTHINDVHLYSSASRLACYCLDNFDIPCSMQFLQFYYQMIKKLPLIEYLSYQPKLYYYLPSFTFQVFNTLSTSTILISEKGNQFITEFSQNEIKQIQEKSAFFTKIPPQIQFSYSNKSMLIDQFLYLLRLNILKKVSESDIKRQPKGKKWANSLISTTVNIPNYQLRHFYQVMNQTKQIIQFQFKQTNNKLEPNIDYKQFALINSLWTKVHCLAQLKTINKKYYYVLEQMERKKHIIQEIQFIKVSKESYKIVELSDEIENSMQVVSYQLTKMFNK